MREEGMRTRSTITLAADLVAPKDGPYALLCDSFDKLNRLLAFMMKPGEYGQHARRLRSAQSPPSFLMAKERILYHPVQDKFAECSQETEIDGTLGLEASDRSPRYGTMRRVREKESEQRVMQYSPQIKFSQRDRERRRLRKGLTGKRKQVMEVEELRIVPAEKRFKTGIRTDEDIASAQLRLYARYEELKAQVYALKRELQLPRGGREGSDDIRRNRSNAIRKRMQARQVARGEGIADVAGRLRRREDQKPKRKAR